MKRALLIAIVVFVVVVAVVAAANWRIFSMFGSRPRVGKVVESWETSNQGFRVRVDQHSEESSFLAGAYYVFRSAPSGTEEWRDVMTFRHDDPVPIPRDQIRFVNDRVGFVFMGWMYAATTDGGSSWSVWDARTDLPNWQCCNYTLIQAVHLETTGKGTMTLKPIRDRSGEVPELHTSDYGRHWSM
jgi:hypothetical protein